MKALKTNLLYIYPEKTNGCGFRSAEAQKSARRFSDGLDLKANHRNTKVYKFPLYSFQACM